MANSKSALNGKRLGVAGVMAVLTLWGGQANAEAPDSTTTDTQGTPPAVATAPRTADTTPAPKPAAARVTAVSSHRTPTQSTAGPQATSATPGTPSAQATPTTPPVTTARHSENARTWYGWQTLVIDGVSVILLGVGVNTQKRDVPVAAALSGLGYVLGGPTVHFAHENIGRGFGSLGLRGGLPMIGFLGGLTFAGCPQDGDSDEGGLPCNIEGAVAGFLLGVAGAITLDAALLAYDDPESALNTAARASATISVAPYINVNRAGLALGGQF